MDKSKWVGWKLKLENILENFSLVEISEYEKIIWISSYGNNIKRRKDKKNR